VLVIVRAKVKLVCRVRTNRGSLRLEHLGDLFERLATIDPPGLEFHRNGSILLWPTPRPRHANIRAPSCDNFALDLDIAESRSCFSSQLAVYIGLLGRPIWVFCEEVVSNFVRNRTCDPGALPDRVLVNNDLHTGNKIGASTGWPPLDNYTVASRLRETRLKCWGFRQKWRQRGINQWQAGRRASPGRPSSCCCGSPNASVRSMLRLPGHDRRSALADRYVSQRHVVSGEPEHDLGTIHPR